MVIAIFILTGCTTRNAFESFNLKNDQESAVENSHSGKIIKNGEVVGLYSAVYLNNVYTHVNDSREAFYISLYKKDGIYHNIKFTLNSKEAIRMDELSDDNQFKHLLSTKNSWSRYYLVTFAEDEKSNANILKIESDLSSSGQVFFLKEQ